MKDLAFSLITFPLTRKRLQNMLSEKAEAALFCYETTDFTVTEDTHFTLGKEKCHA